MKEELKAAAQARGTRTPSAGRVRAAGQPGSSAGERDVEDALVPNATTIEAMREGRRRKGSASLRQRAGALRRAACDATDATD